MYLTRRVGEKGQVVIPEEIRRAAGIIAGTPLLFDFKDDKIIVKLEKTAKEFLDEFCEVIPKEKRLKFDVEKLLEEEYEERLGKRRSK